MPRYAEYAGPLMSKLQLNRQDGKKGSTKVLEWGESEIASFEQLKKVLTQQLELFRVVSSNDVVAKLSKTETLC